MEPARRVLVLDDDADFCALLADYLGGAAGAVCLCARSVPELARLGADALRCDLAILDVNLGPNQASGIDALEWLRSHAFAGRVVFLTGHGRQHPLLRARAGHEPIEVLEKPIDADTLAELVSSTEEARPR